MESLKIRLHLVIRNFLKQLSLNTLNLIGFIVGMITTGAMVIYLDHELTYDKWHTHSQNIYRLEGQLRTGMWLAHLGMEHGEELASNKYPEVTSIVRINPGSRTFFEYEGRRFAESKIIQTSVGSEFFEFFDFRILEGNKSTVLSEPDQIVLTKSTALKYFQEQSPVGKVIYMDTIPLIVSGVIEDLPTRTHLNFDMILSNHNLYERDHYHTRTFLKLQANADAQLLEQKILQMDVNQDDNHRLHKVNLMPLSDIHLESEAAFEPPRGDKLQMLAIAIICALILLITVTNYINLSTVNFMQKSREVGIRKALGESRQQVFYSFFVESLILMIPASILILAGINIVIPLVNNYLEVNLQNIFVEQLSYSILAISLLMVVAFHAVIVPAHHLSRSNVDQLIKSKSSTGAASGFRFRNVLLFIQLLLLFALGISAWFMNEQIRFMDDKDMGFEAENVIRIDNAYDIGDYHNYEILKTRLLTYPEISGVAFGPIMGDGMVPLSYRPEGEGQNYENLLSYGVDLDYFDVMGIEILNGEFKTSLNSADNGQIISLVNQSFVDRFGWNANPIGKKIILRPGTENELNRKVSAVFEDFHFYSLKEKISPQIISLRPDPQFVHANVLIKMSAKNYKKVSDILRKEWYAIQPDLPVEIGLMEDSVKELYKRERQTSRISMFSSTLAIGLLISGLIGFIVNIISMRSKEIAMRRVLGATLFQIVTLLNWQLTWMILVSSIVGGAVSYYIIAMWLQDYAYVITMSPIVFLLATVLVLLIVYLITGIQSVRSSLTNPALALKNE